MCGYICARPAVIALHIRTHSDAHIVRAEVQIKGRGSCAVVHKLTMYLKTPGKAGYT